MVAFHIPLFAHFRFMNHEKSKKHKENVILLKQLMKDEESNSELEESANEEINPKNNENDEMLNLHHEDEDANKPALSSHPTPTEGAMSTSSRSDDIHEQENLLEDELDPQTIVGSADIKELSGSDEVDDDDDLAAAVRIAHTTVKQLVFVESVPWFFYFLHGRKEVFASERLEESCGAVGLSNENGAVLESSDDER